MNFGKLQAPPLVAAPRSALGTLALSFGRVVVDLSHLTPDLSRQQPRHLAHECCPILGIGETEGDLVAGIPPCLFSGASPGDLREAVLLAVLAKRAEAVDHRQVVGLASDAVSAPLVVGLGLRRANTSFAKGRLDRNCQHFIAMEHPRNKLPEFGWLLRD